MEIDIFLIDAFTDRLFSGNPAAVCVLVDWLADDILQVIANENNVSATAFIVPREGNYHIRWFTPTTEISLCGHATLASAYVVFEKLEPKREGVTFQSQSGALTVIHCKNGLYALDFPANEISACEPPEELIKGLGATPVEVYRAKNYLVVLASEKEVREVNPQFEQLRQLETHGIIITAKGDHADFVSRYFAPALGINEDPVTGTAHCMLAPFWAERLGKTHLHAKQLSKRQGEIFCDVKGDRVILQGKVVPYLQGVIKLG